MSLIELSESFHPQRISAVTHTLSEHRLFQLPELVALAQRLEKTGAVRFHSDKADVSTNFTFAPDTHKIARPASEIVADIEHANAWLALHNVQQDDIYRALIDEVMADVKQRVEKKDPGMCYFAGWIFVTSPGAVTPYHMDHENNFILQLRGTKELHVFDPLNREVVTERSLELFHGKGSRELVTYLESHEKAATVFQLKPGMGGYMPRTAPHWVKNGPEVSITASFTYYTDETRRTKAIHQVNEKLRRVGLSPHPVGKAPLRDLVKYSAARVLRAKRIAQTGVRYAPV